MRRWLSIALVGCVIHLTLAPAFAMSMSLQACCRRATQPIRDSANEMSTEHCHGAMNSNAVASKASVPVETTLHAGAGKCPMTCCDQSQSVSKFAVALGASASSISTEAFGAVQSISVFVANGFSSHTDRGPPSLLLS
ncbi:MAG: hypothetical protein JWO13_1394 [Acidobacteriales bacterium]|nr:hypothetical protein [Terriglobales bacterium]